MKSKKQNKSVKGNRGLLRIGNDWNAITIIALSQNNPLKAIAEFVENSIDAGARNVTIMRGKEKGSYYLKIIDDGKGVPQTESGIPDFKYVATHICDSIKKRLKNEGVQGLQGEFGIGLLSFWTVGEHLSLLCSGCDGVTYEMSMEKDAPGYAIRKRGHLLPIEGTTLKISPLLPGMKMLNGEKLERYLSSELRDRIKSSGVTIEIIDRVSRVQLTVEPRQFSGQLLHNLPQLQTPYGEIYTELYINEKESSHAIQIFRNGTRVMPNMAVLDGFDGEPWTSGIFEGIIDIPFLQLTPGTRDGIIRDERYEAFVRVLAILSEALTLLLQEKKQADEERTNKNILRSIQNAFREAFYSLPPEEYDWFDIYEKRRAATKRPQESSSENAEEQGSDEERYVLRDKDDPSHTRKQKQFFEVAGPLFSCRISPANTLVMVEQEKKLTVIGMDKSRRVITEPLPVEWRIVSGEGVLTDTRTEHVVFTAPETPGITTLKARVEQRGIVCEAEAVITIVESIAINKKNDTISEKGLPGYTLESVPSKIWRSYYDEKRNIIVVNSGHRDFLFASKHKTRKVRYLLRLFAKELLCQNFIGMPTDQMLERLVELSLYAEENLK
jgi:hypothetical protein